MQLVHLCSSRLNFSWFLAPKKIIIVSQNNDVPHSPKNNIHNPKNVLHPLNNVVYPPKSIVHSLKNIMNSLKNIVHSLKKYRSRARCNVSICRLRDGDTALP